MRNVVHKLGVGNLYQNNYSGTTHLLINDTRNLNINFIDLSIDTTTHVLLS